LSFNFSILFLKFTKKVTSSQTIKRYTQDQRLKLTQRTMEKSHFNLSTGQFLLSKYKILKGLHLLNDTCWVFDQRNLNFKKKKTDISLISFQQLDFEIDIIFEIWELIPEQERLSNKKSTYRVCKILDKSNINTSRHFLKSWAVGGNTVDPEKEKQALFRSARGQ
jgi:hypothetical protein